MTNACPMTRDWLGVNSLAAAIVSTDTPYVCEIWYNVCPFWTTWICIRVPPFLRKQRRHIRAYFFFTIFEGRRWVYVYWKMSIGKVCWKKQRTQLTSLPRCGWKNRVHAIKIIDLAASGAERSAPDARSGSGEQLAISTVRAERKRSGRWYIRSWVPHRIEAMEQLAVPGCGSVKLSARVSAERVSAVVFRTRGDCSSART